MLLIKNGRVMDPKSGLDQVCDVLAQNGKENTLALAKQYSRDTVAPLLGNTTGKTYSYIHPISIFHGAELYVNGGNYYYSRQVQLNLYIIKCFTLFSTSG